MRRRYNFRIKWSGLRIKKKLNPYNLPLNTLLRSVCPCILIFMFSITCLTTAEENIAAPDKEKILTKREITADSLKWEYGNRIAIFTGNVTMVAEEGDITASKMTVFFNEEDEIEKMVGEGTVSLIREKQKGGGEIIEIYPSQDLLVLKQRAWISSEKALFKGEEISFDTAKEIINITQGVKGEIQTEREEKSLQEDTKLSNRN